MKQGLTFLALLVLAVVAGWYSLSPNYPIQEGLDLKGGMRVVLEPDTAKLGSQKVDAETLDHVREVLENRVNSFGLSGTDVRLKGQDQILILLPGVQNPQEALEKISKVAQLEFRHLTNVESNRNPSAQYKMSTIPGNPAKNQPEQYKFTDSATGKPVAEDDVLKDAPLIVKGDSLKPTSQAQIDPQNGQPEVTFEFNSQGADVFATFTSENVGEILAVVLDGKVITAPNINTPITEGRGQISGGFATMADARMLANLLNSGALPIPLRAAQTEYVGATLGQASITKSIRAGAIGLGLVLLFMLGYYWLPGAIACIALLIYAGITFSIFKGIGGLLPPIVLDLPGITGFILSVGMAVDANILIFERLKEELRAGKNLHSAIDAGFSRAFSAILDSNVTTWIVCAILIWLGTPLIRGFAITLVIGVVVSMFTAITVTRTILHLVIAMPWARNEALYGLNTGWLQLVFPAVRRGAVLRVFEKRKVYLGASLVSFVIAMLFILASPFGMGLRPGIDFTGGTALDVPYHQKVSQENVLAALPKSLNATVSIGHSEEPWTKVTIETQDVDPASAATIKDRLVNSNVIRGLDASSYQTSDQPADSGAPKKSDATSKPADKTAANAPAAKPAANAPAANSPAANAPAAKPAANAPAANEPAAKGSANAPAANAPAAKTAANAPAANAPAANAPAANTPAAKPAANAPAANVPAGKKAADTKPADKKPAGKPFRATVLFTTQVTEADVRKALETAPPGDDSRLNLIFHITTDSITHTGDNAITVANIQSRSLHPDELKALKAELEKLGGGIIQPMYQESSIGPSIAKEIIWNAFGSVVVASLAIILYLAFRFAIGGFVNGLKFGSSAVIAEIHDVSITVGFFALMGALLHWQVDSLFVTACLTVLGFSVHDTIVVYDRIRENLYHRAKGETFSDVTNRSVTQTFDRSINTSFTVLLVVAALAIFGGESIRLFNVALLFGIAIGTYSSVFVASPLVVLFERMAATRAPLPAPAPAAGRSVRRDDVALTPRRREATVTPTATRPTATPTVRPVSPAAAAGVDAVDDDVDESGGSQVGGTRARPSGIKPKKKRRL